jgi:hypothetical protein
MGCLHNNFGEGGDMAFAVMFRRMMAGVYFLPLAALAVQLPPAGYNLVFEDNFDSLKLDTSTNPNSPPTGPWQDHYPLWNNYRGLAQYEGIWVNEGYVGNGVSPLGLKIHEISDSGTLTLRAFPTPCDKFANVDYAPYVCPMIGTQKTLLWHEGYFEFRTRFTLQSSVHLGIWLFRNTSSHQEIDFIEGTGRKDAFGVNKQSTITCDVKGPISGGFGYTELAGTTPWLWHTYGCLWEPDSINFYIDGTVYDAVKLLPEGMPDSMYFQAWMAIDNDQWMGTIMPESTWPMELEFDYFRVYTNH